MTIRAARLALSVLGTAGMCLLSLAPATAATILVEPIITQPNPNFPDGEELPPELLPNRRLRWNVPDTSGEQNVLNGTGLTMTNFYLVLLTEQYNGNEVLWGDANGDGQIGQSDIFSSITVNPNNPIPQLNITGGSQLEITGGSIPNGNRFVFQFITNPDLTPEEPRTVGPIQVAGLYNGVPRTPIFEPSPGLGLVLLAAGYVSKKAWKKHKIWN